MAIYPSLETRLFLLGVGISAIAGVGLMRYMLNYYRDTVPIEPSRPKTQYITQKTEDSLRVSTLQKLFDSDSYSVKETTAKIVSDRAVHDDVTIDALLIEVGRPEYHRRDRAIRALIYLTERFGIGPIRRQRTYEALVACLSHCLGDTDHDECDLDFDCFYLRDAIERNCLHVLVRLGMTYGPSGLLRAGFVDKWLAKQPWGRSEEDMQFTFNNYWLSHYNDLSSIIREIHGHPEGLRQLRKARLVADYKDASVDSAGLLSRENMETQHSVRNPEAEPRRREQSTEGERVRRRHREAMVFNDGLEPIGRNDIFQREDDNGNDTSSHPDSPVLSPWELRVRDEDLPVQISGEG